ncbi:hypothetical protein UA38_20030 [Photobacterium kishitanii]|uniref:Fimbrial-type adhesion domain-containing protein n=2 Tax=Photobacterium kishitanii TaxID=318456 RepID=A0AAX0YPL1_9GAMM|nr:hypothetical protein UA38_20030 [Photobacterium kishitanii]KJG63666.1 hypothetical protein UA40_20725 [Photobacterium kishitanii]PSX16855.1 hypothetical protein C0W70_22365 [Photobacterium kishitanii]PSX26604.1 hypothetical protein C0W52_17120 [Photobacterium kishitanii]PSX29102.1 hypothetical protein C0W39_21255 [Photobacterium kishitanii]
MRLNKMKVKYISFLCFFFSINAIAAVTNVDLGVLEQGQRVTVYKHSVFTIDWPVHKFNCGKPILMSPKNVSVAPLKNAISYDITPTGPSSESVFLSGKVGDDFNSFIYGYKNYLVLNGTNAGDNAYVRGIGLDNFVSNSKWELQLRSCGFNKLANEIGYPGAIARITVDGWVVDARNLMPGSYNDKITLKSQTTGTQQFSIKYKVVKKKTPTCALILPRQTSSIVTSTNIDLGRIYKGQKKITEESFSLNCKDIAKVNVSYLMNGELFDNNTATSTVNGGLLKIIDKETQKPLKLDNTPYQLLGVGGNLDINKKLLIINDATNAKSGGGFNKRMNINYRYE